MEEYFMIKFTLPEYTHLYSKIFNIPDLKNIQQASPTNIAIATGLFLDVFTYTSYFWVLDNYYNSYIPKRDWCQASGTNNDLIIGIRPVINFTSIDEMKDLINGDLQDIGNGIKKGKVFIPSNPATNNNKLSKLLSKGKLNKIDSNIVTFPTNSNDVNDSNKPLNLKHNNYYEYDGNLYLLLTVNSSFTR